MPTTIKIGSRASALALAQSQSVMALLAEQRQDWRLECSSFSTTGDRITDKPLAEIGGKALFVKELELELLRGNIDAAVHSLKDVPGDMDEDIFRLLPVGARADARDALVLPEGVAELDSSGPIRIGTGSTRRGAQLQQLYPNCHIKPLRGNVQTRLAKLARGEFDAIVLAAAGLLRLDLQSNINSRFSVEQLVPAIGQGVLALQVRRDDSRWDWLPELQDPELARCVDCERALARALGADCFTTLGAHARCRDGQLCLDLFYLHPDTQQAYKQQFHLANNLAGAALEAKMQEIARSMQA